MDFYFLWYQLTKVSGVKFEVGCCLDCLAGTVCLKWGALVLYIDGLVQDCSISSALAMEILQFCNKSSIYSLCRIFVNILTLRLFDVLPQPTSDK